MRPRSHVTTASSSPLLSPTADDLRAGLSIFALTDALGAFDAVLAACAARNGIQAVVSADISFAGLAEVSHVIPDERGVSGLLSG